MATTEAGPDAAAQSQTTQRMRWATRRVKSVGKAANRRKSIVKRFQKNQQAEEKKRQSGSSGDSPSGDSPSGDSPDGAGQDNEGQDNDTASEEADISARRVYFNQPLPKDELDQDGRPLQKFARNKIRTAKFTPLSFVPKDLYYQFHNIANCYFLFLIILTFFSIFGGANPYLNAVPLIVILIVTAVKDAIEDYRRTVLDNELNNSPIHRLVDWHNVNSTEDSVGPWRRIKKATSHGLAALWRSMKRKTKKNKGEESKNDDEAWIDRHSFDTIKTKRESRVESRLSKHEDIQMTEVRSQLRSQLSDYHDAPTSPPMHTDTGFSFEAGGNSQVEPVTSPISKSQTGPPAARFYGSLIDPFKEPTGKARFKRDYWKNVQVGDFVRIYNDDQLPADVIVLATSDPDGACYVETKNLDGETNLKVRNALNAGRSIRHARDCEQATFEIESEEPHANLYKYNGAVRWMQRDQSDREKPGTQMTEPIGINNVLLRGCSLRNTEWVLGVVIFTGQESKIMLNAGITPTKRSQITRDLNWNVAYNFVILFIMCLVGGIIEGITWGEGNQSLNFFEFGAIGKTPALDGFITFWSLVILFQNLVPISLYITLEIIRTAQAFFIYSDVHMYYDKIDYPCTPKSWNISDDVGQIEYIFSDKTGTLTQNIMEFKKCTVNGVPYGEAYTEAQAGMQARQGIDTVAEATKANKQIAVDRVRMIDYLRKLYVNPYFKEDDLTFVAPDFIEDLDGASGEEQKGANETFMLALSLCHSVLTEKTPGDPPKIEFKAQSPDEAALVGTARDCGYTFTGRSTDGIFLNVQGEEREYTVLNILEFNSSRKRMSAIIRMPDNRIILFCKGADSIIYSRLRKGEQKELRKTTGEHLEMFAREGLRTLCIAQKEISEVDYQEWSKQHDVAAAAVQNREEKLEEVSDAIERDLSLLGGTAIEDRLQDGVPDTIQLLGRAGIKLWVLTGDKVETAINIGFSCNLLSNDMDLIVLRIGEGDAQEAREQLDKHLATFNMTGSDEELEQARKDHEPPPPTHALVIDGDSLKIVLEEELRQKFLLLCKQCRSVLCCRVSPSQKAAVVQMVKQGLDVMTLSVGDGANDVAMIQEANVGVGIAGEEGRQAVMSSDYAIGQFRFLSRLILVHGRWSYRRVGETIANFFYKNIVWTMALFWYQIFNSFDCSYLFDYTYILLYNVVFTSLPIIFMGILDQDVNDKVSLAVPQLYRRGIERKEWTQTKFWTYMIDGIYQSVMVYFMAWLLFMPAVNVSANGLNLDETRHFGAYVANAAIVVVNVYILMNTYRWDWLMVTLVTISALLIFLWTAIYSCFTVAGFFYGLAGEVYGQPTFWAITLMTVAICLMPRFTAKSFQKIFLPYDVDVIREQIRQGKFKHLDDIPPEDVANQVANKYANGDGSSSSAPGTSSATAVASPTLAEHGRQSLDEDRKPIYPPSISQTTTTHNGRSQNGSDGTDYITARPVSIEVDREPEQSRYKHAGALSPPIESLTPNTATYPERPGLERTLTPRSATIERMTTPLSRPLSQVSTNTDRPRPSFERLRTSMDRTRPSFEALPDMTSWAQLSRVESSHSDHARSAPTSTPASPTLSPTSPLRGRREFPLSPLGRKGGYDR